MARVAYRKMGAPHPTQRTLPPLSDLRERRQVAIVRGEVEHGAAARRHGGGYAGKHGGAEAPGCWGPRLLRPSDRNVDPGKAELVEGAGAVFPASTGEADMSM